MQSIHVTSKDRFWNDFFLSGATHSVSILDPGDELPRADWWQKMVDNGTMLKLRFLDETEADVKNGPRPEHVRTLLEWSAKLPEDSVVLVHCFAGVSRSTAAALAILAQKTGDPEKAAQVLKGIRPGACPNILISRAADEILEFSGELEKASERIVEGHILSFLK